MYSRKCFIFAHIDQLYIFEKDYQKSGVINLNIITIDGLSGTGKTARAKELARYLNYNFFSIGYIFRVVAYLAIYNNILNLSRINFKPCEDENSPHPFYILLDEVNITDYLHGDSKIDDFCISSSSDKNILESVKKIMYSIVKQGNWVVEGRSAAAFFPNARVKFLLICSKEERKKRVLCEMIKKGLDESAAEAIWETSEKRNYADTYLSVSPLRCYIDSIIIDSTYLQPNQTLHDMIEYCENELGKKDIKSEYDIDVIEQESLNLKATKSIFGCLNMLNCFNPIFREHKNVLFSKLEGSFSKDMLEEHLAYHLRINNACVIDRMFKYYIRNKKHIYIVSNLHQHLNIDLKGDIISLRKKTLKNIDEFTKTQSFEEKYYRKIITYQCFYDSYIQEKLEKNNVLSRIGKWAIENYAPDDYVVIDISFDGTTIEQALVIIQNIFYKKYNKTLFFILVSSETLSLWNIIIQTLISNIPIFCVDKIIWEKGNLNF